MGYVFSVTAPALWNSISLDIFLGLALLDFCFHMHWAGKLNKSPWLVDLITVMAQSRILTPGMCSSVLFLYICFYKLCYSLEVLTLCMPPRVSLVRWVVI